MKKPNQHCGLLRFATGFGAVVGVPLLVEAADFQNPPVMQKNRFSLSGTLSFNISAKFSDLGGFPLPSYIGAAAGGDDRFYDDGFNRMDASGLGDGKTWFWGYSSATQERGTGPATLLDMNRSSPAGNGVSDNNKDDPHPGFELSYARHISKLGSANWGVVGAFGFTSIGISDSGRVIADGIRVTDSFATDGILLPAPGFSGTASGFNQRIDNAPTSRTFTQLPGGATINGSRELDADLFFLKLGPYVEFAISERFAVGLSGGVIGARINTDYTFSESVTVVSTGPTGDVTQSVRGSDSDGEWRAGAFVEGKIAYSLTDRWSVHAGVQYSYLGDVEQTLVGRGVSLDLGKTLMGSLGVGFSF